MLEQRIDAMRGRAMPVPPGAADTGTGSDPVMMLRLMRSRRVGARTFHRLLGEYGDAATAFAALPDIARAAGAKDYTPCPEGVVTAELRAGKRLGARLILWGMPDYPQALAALPDAPPALWVLGDMSLLQRPAVAVVGARNASALGLRMARGLAGGLSQAGLTVVAGLARGVDTAAHEAALDGGTIAILAGGLDRIYPSENTGLAAQIASDGLLISEQPPGVEPAARLFPLRNRIVSGLARAVVVVEAAHRSGTLITAGCAAEQGREVMAVPGHPMDARAAGCNALIRDGAALVRNSDDVLAALGLADAGLAARRIGPDVADQRSGPERISQTLARPGPTAEGGPVGRFGNRRRAKAMTGPDRSRAEGGPITRLDKSPRDTGGPIRQRHLQAASADHAGLRARILALLGPSPTSEDEVLRSLDMDAAPVLALLGRMELEGLITRSAGSSWTRSPEGPG